MCNGTFSRHFYSWLVDMRRTFWFLLPLLWIWGCTLLPLKYQPTTVPQIITNTPILDAGVLPDVKAIAQAYLDAWKAEDYPAMYSLLTSVSRDAITEEEFTNHYKSVMIEAALLGFDYEILAQMVNPETAQVQYRVILNSILVGEIIRDTLMNLTLENTQWRVQWDDTLVLPELRGGNYLLMDRQGYIPSRANIYDRDGRALVAQADAAAVGVYPDQIDPAQKDLLLATLAELTRLRVDTIQAMIDSSPTGLNWYVPLGEVSADRVASKFDIIKGLRGLTLSQYKSRYYFDGGIAPHVIGYVSAIPADEVGLYQRKGYQQDDRVGRAGLEKWGESYLAGERGGALYVFNAQGQPVTRLAEKPSQPSQAIFTTLEKDFQLAAQKAIEPFPGAIVVLERDTGRVLAMVSSPGFDPNAFEPINYNSSKLLSEIINNPSQPLFNRSTQGQYPLGSVFKIITMAAALESGYYNAGTTYQCGYLFEELEGVVLNDWTYDYFTSDGRTIPSGLLTLPEGLIRSCNPFFFHIGLDLYNRGLKDAIADMARGFGLGSTTRVDGVEEETGQVVDPISPIDATNSAIGQGELLVTPLQVASFVAAVGNGGILFRPQVVERIAPPDGFPTFVFKPEENSRLPVSSENLQIIQQAMVGVIRNEKPRGTAWHRFTGLDINVAGKTGTAQTGSGRPHAWFAGYTFEGRPDRPDIAIAVVVESIGEGSDYAAPIFRRIVELYFSGQPQKLYWWESGYNIPLVSPTQPSLPTPTLTPTP
jgi:penicillin-binding protein 2